VTITQADVRYQTAPLRVINVNVFIKEPGLAAVMMFSVMMAKIALTSVQLNLVVILEEEIVEDINFIGNAIKIDQRSL